MILYCKISYFISVNNKTLVWVQTLIIIIEIQIEIILHLFIYNTNK
jgi:hypothetical protein